MASILDHYNPEVNKSNMDWAGLRSCKFGRTKQILSHPDSIRQGLDFPSQINVRGRKHFSEHNSPEHQFRSILRIIPPIQHWHPRKSNKKIVDMKLSEPHPRRERGHHIPEYQLTERPAGIRTFYNTRIREENSKEYRLQDIMQRKKKIDQREARNSFNRFRQQNRSLI